MKVEDKAPELVDVLVSSKNIATNAKKEGDKTVRYLPVSVNGEKIDVPCDKRVKLAPHFAEALAPYNQLIA